MLKSSSTDQSCPERGLSNIRLARSSESVGQLGFLCWEAPESSFSAISLCTRFGNQKFRNSNQARKRHININFLVRLLLGHPGNVPGTNRVCPRDKVGLSQGQTQVFSLFYTAEAQFVPGTNPVCPWDIPGTKGSRKSLCVKSLCASLSFPIQKIRKSKIRKSKNQNYCDYLTFCDSFSVII